MGYHKQQIEKGVLGEISKITEEYQELLDAHDQEDVVLQICELTDLIGAIESYIMKWGLTIKDLKKFSDKTKQAFKVGKR